MMLLRNTELRLPEFPLDARRRRAGRWPYGTLGTLSDLLMNRSIGHFGSPTTRVDVLLGEPTVTIRQRTNPLRGESSSRHAKATGCPDRPPWHCFTHSGDFERHGCRGQAWGSNRSSRSLRRAADRNDRPPQRLPEEHSHPQDLGTRRFDVSLCSAAGHVRHLKRRSSGAIRREQAFPSAFRTNHSRRDQELLHVIAP
jgi:hypothetical protein